MIPKEGIVRTLSGHLTGWNLGPPPPVDCITQLGRMPRFAGATLTYWSVLHHSLLMYDIALAENNQHCLAALVHDFSEILIGDIPGPMKSGEYDEMERRWVERLCKEWELSVQPWGSAWPYIIELDNRVLQLEGYTLCQDSTFTASTSEETRMLKAVVALSCPQDGYGVLHQTIAAILKGGP